MTRASRFEIDPQPVQHIRAPGDLGRFEGVAFSPSGKLLAVAASDANVVFIYRRKPDGQFEDTPGQRLGGKLGFPHDVAFSHCGRLLAVAERRGAVTLYETDRAGDGVGPEPVFEISGPDSQLDFSDGAAFVPPDDRYLAVCITLQGIIAFFKRRTPAGFEGTPEFELRHPSISDPDGLAFSACGRWLALANH